MVCSCEPGQMKESHVNWSVCLVVAWVCVVFECIQYSFALKACIGSKATLLLRHRVETALLQLLMWRKFVAAIYYGRLTGQNAMEGAWCSRLSSHPTPWFNFAAHANCNILGLASPLRFRVLYIKSVGFFASRSRKNIVMHGPGCFLLC